MIRQLVVVVLDSGLVLSACSSEEAAPEPSASPSESADLHDRPALK